MKTKTVTLSYIDVCLAFNGAPGWRVDKICDSIEYPPGVVLSKVQVQELCDARDWKVTIIPVTPSDR